MKVECRTVASSSGSCRNPEWNGLARLAQRLKIVLLAISMALGAAGCVGVAVETAYDRKVRFDRYDSFAMMLPNKPVQTSADMNPFTMQRLRQLTYIALSARGLESTDKANADLLVSVLAGSKSRVQVYSRNLFVGGPYYGGYGPYYGGYGAFYGGPGWGYDVREYEEIVVAIDLIDPKTNAVVWRGKGSRRIRGALSDEEMQTIVQSIVSRYPPTAEPPS